MSCYRYAGVLPITRPFMSQNNHGFLVNIKTNETDSKQHLNIGKTLLSSARKNMRRFELVLCFEYVHELMHDEGSLLLSLFPISPLGE